MADPTAEEEVRQQKLDTAAARAALPEVTPPTLPKVGDPNYVGPVLPAPTLFGVGLKGRARFQAMVNQLGAGFGSGVWGHDFNVWVMGLQEDANDPEFNAVLQWAKANAQKAEQSRENENIIKTPGKKPTTVDASTWKVPDNVAGGTVMGAPSTPVKPGVTPGTTSGSEKGITPEQIKQEKIARYEWEEQLGSNREIWSKTVGFKGGPEAAEALMAQGVPIEDVEAFLNGEGIQLEPGTSNVALRSGEYVYMGKEYSEEYGATRDFYMYGDDAENALASIDATVIQSWQTQLGLDPTGVVDPDLARFWDTAVDQARRYAAVGGKVSVRDLMDMYVASAAKSRAGRGGGGGGGGGLEGTPEDQAAVDYYRAMMAILGDISGVPNAQA